MGVFHGGSVMMMVRSLMYQELDALELSVLLMFFPGKDGEMLAGCF